MIRLTSMTVGASQSPVLHDVDLALPWGEITVLVGANGAGKSTLARVLTGQLGMSTGSLDLPTGTRVVMVPQDPVTGIVAPSVVEQVGLGGALKGVPSSRVLEQAREALSLVEIAHLEGADPALLSGGQQMLVAVASAVCDLDRGQGLVIFDEATAWLDAVHADRVRALARRVAALGSAVLWITQDPSELPLGSALVELEAGGIRTLAPGEVPTCCAPLSGYGREARTIGPVMAQVESVAVQGRLAPVTFLAHAGEIVAVTGPSGSGKTTLLRTLAGLDVANLGRVTRPLDNAERPGAALLLQRAADTMIAERVIDDVALGLVLRGRSESLALERAGEALNEVGLPVELYANRDTLALSGGQRQRVALAAACIVGAPLLVLDEPSAGLDRAGLESLVSVLRRRANDGHAVVLSSHDARLLDALQPTRVELQPILDGTAERARSRHDVAPWPGLVAMVAYIAATILATRPWLLAGVAASTVVWALLVTPFARLRPVLSSIAALAVGIVVLQSVVGLAADSDPVMAGFQSVARLSAIMLAATTALGGAHPVRLTATLQRWGLPTGMARTLGLALGLVSVFERERNRLVDAVTARGLPRRGQGLRPWLTRQRITTMPVVVAGLRTSRELATTLVLRGWNPGVRQSVLVHPSARVYDLFAAAVAVVFLVLGVVVR